MSEDLTPLDAIEERGAAGNGLPGDPSALEGGSFDHSGGGEPR